MTDYNGYAELAAAIVLQAYKDFCTCVKIVKCGRDDERTRQAKAEMASIIKFVNGKWYERYTTIPRDRFLKRLAEVANG